MGQSTLSVIGVLDICDRAPCFRFALRSFLISRARRLDRLVNLLALDSSTVAKRGVSCLPYLCAWRNPTGLSHAYDIEPCSAFDFLTLCSLSASFLIYTLRVFVSLAIARSLSLPPSPKLQSSLAMSIPPLKQPKPLLRVGSRDTIGFASSGVDCTAEIRDSRLHRAWLVPLLCTMQI